jgi:hypothetical protein
MGSVQFGKDWLVPQRGSVKPIRGRRGDSRSAGGRKF